jgi:hypothetical protein
VSVGAVIGAALGLAAAGAGVGLLRRAWRRPSPGWWTLAGWALLIAATPAWALGAGWDKAIALALLVPSLAGFAFVCANLEMRRKRARRLARAATALPDTSGEGAWRAWARAACGGPLSGAAAVLIAAAWALKGLGSQADRAAEALVLAPVIWAAGLTWSTTDGRLARVGMGLGASALAGGLAAAF